MKFLPTIVKNRIMLEDGSVYIEKCADGFTRVYDGITDELVSIHNRPANARVAARNYSERARLAVINSYAAGGADAS